jgi:hypothetical protein
MDMEGQARVRPKQQYLSSTGRANMLYFVPAITEAPLRETAMTLIISEGDLKRSCFGDLRF